MPLRLMRRQCRSSSLNSAQVKPSGVQMRSTFKRRECAEKTQLLYWSTVATFAESRSI